MNPTRSALFSNILEEIASESTYVNLCLAFFTQYPIG